MASYDGVFPELRDFILLFVLQIKESELLT